MLMSHKKKGHHHHHHNHHHNPHHNHNHNHNHNHHHHKNKDSKSWCSIEKLRGDKKIPKTFNWNDKGYVTSVRMQGQCGSCYIFSSVAAMESQYMINVKKKEIDFSEQALLNCVNNGCKGGWPYDVMKRMIMYGVSLEENAPYNSKVRKSCSLFLVNNY